MARSKPPLLRLHEMAVGQSGDFFALLSEHIRGARKDGKPFYTCRFRDAGRVASFMVWSDGPWFKACEKQWLAGQFYKIRGHYTEHETYGSQIDIVNIRPVVDEDRTEGFQPLDFVERTQFDVEAMFQELWAIAETHLENVPLRRLVLTVLHRHAKQWKQVPGSAKHYYPFAGGLLEHTLSVTHACIHLADKYVSQYPDLHPPLNRDLVVAGAILHDAGRLVEFNDDLIHPEATVDGRLFGHLILGRDLVREAARELGDVEPEWLRLLEHLLLCYLTLPEWGSPRLPMIPEALILHHADDLDAKLEMYVRCLTRDKEPGNFTARDPVLGKALFKGRTV